MARPDGQSDAEGQPANAPMTHPRAVAAIWPDKPAVIDGDTGEAITYGELVDRADRCSNLIAALGVPSGGTIAIFVENSLTFAELCWAAKNSGLYYVCISVHLNTDDLAYILDNCGARLLFVSSRTAAAAQAALDRLDHQPTLIITDSHRPGFIAYEAALVEQPASPLDGRPAGASMLYSSGTTGRPKAVRPALDGRAPTDPPRRHAMLVDRFGFDGNMVFINPGPLYHAAPLRMMMAALRLGGTAVVFRKFDAAAVLRAIERWGGTHGFFVPTMFVRMLRLKDDGFECDVSSMHCAIHGAAPCARLIKEAMLAWWGPVVHEIYGGTEGMGQTTILARDWINHPGSVGRPPPGCTVRIVDENGRVLGPNEAGLIYMFNGNRFEYLGDPEKTQATQNPDGYATFGDIGHLDEDGYLYLTDRQSHMIISGGVNIYPQEAENLLIAHPAIDDVAVIGVPNEEFGEEVKAVVLPRTWPTDPAGLERDILDWCCTRLSAIKCPRSVDFVQELPRSEAGKLLKREIRAPYWDGHATLIGSR